MRLTLSGSVSASRRFGCLISPARASSVSRSPYSVMSCAAVLSPMPGAPGTLSVESPASAWTSTTLSAADAEIFDHFGRAEAPLLARARDPGLAGSRVVHRDAGIDELHEVLVGRDDEDVGAGLARLTRVSGDDVVGLVAALLDRDHAERRDGGAHERETAARARRADPSGAPCRPGRGRAGTSSPSCRRSSRDGSACGPPPRRG